MSDEMLLISDMHTFSNWGLLHPDYVGKDVRTGKEDVMYVPNAMQRWTFDFWENMIKKNKNISAIGFIGDLIDGINPYNYGAVGNNDIYEQIRMSAMLIEMLPYDVPMYFVGGTKFHSGNDVTAEQLIADMTGGKYSLEGVIEECGVRIFMNHYIPHAQNKAGSLEKKIKEISAAEKCYGKIDVLVGAHNHVFSCTMTSTHIAIMTPGWQHKTPYAIGKNLIAPPDIGYVKLIIEDKDLISVDRRGVVTSPFGPPILKRNINADD